MKEAFDSSQLNETEKGVLEAVKAGVEFSTEWRFAYVERPQENEQNEPKATAIEAAFHLDQQKPLEDAPFVRAAFLRELLLGLNSGWPSASQGVRIRGARIVGELDLIHARARDGGALAPLCLYDCHLDSIMRAQSARMERLEFWGCLFKGLDAEFIHLVGPLAFYDSILTERRGATIGICWARIGGALGATRLSLCPDGEEFTFQMFQAEVHGMSALKEIGRGDHRDKPARVRMHIWESTFFGELDISNSSFAHLDAKRIHAHQNMLLGGCKSHGKIDLEQAHIEGDLRADNVKFDENAQGLVLVGAHIEGACLMRRGTVCGGITMMAARLDGGWELGGTTIVAGSDKWAVAGREARFGGSVWMREEGGTRFSAKGLIGFRRGHFLGDLDMRGAHLTALPGLQHTELKSRFACLYAAGARIAGDVRVGESRAGSHSIFEGAIVFDGANIEGDLELTGGVFTTMADESVQAECISLCDATIGGHLHARGFGGDQTTGIVDLTGASARVLHDEGGRGWGEMPKRKKDELISGVQLRLNGFHYQRIEPPSTNKRSISIERRAWLERQYPGGVRRGEFHPQPYDELVRALRSDGRVQDARKISVFKRVTRRRAGEASPVDWVVNALYQLTFDYGFSPVRASLTLISFWALGVVGLTAAQSEGVLTPLIDGACEDFSPGLQALRLIVPLPNVIGATTCVISNASQAWKIAEVSYSVCGALLLALAVLTFSGVMRNEQRH